MPGVVHFRVDDRLIHGQVTTTWSGVVQPNRILLANDAVAKDPLLQSLQKVSAPKGMSVTILPVLEAAELLAAGKFAEDRVFLLAKSLEDAALLVRDSPDITSVNIGNLGYKPNAKQISTRVFLSPGDQTALQELLSRGVKVTIQMMPTDRPTVLTKV